MNIQLLEELQNNAFPALQAVLYDGWLLRFGGGFTYRVNCANSFMPSTLLLAEKADFTERQYQSKGLIPIIKIHRGQPAQEITELDSLLDSRGYTTERRGNIFLLPLPICGPEIKVDISYTVEDDWLRDFLDMNSTTVPSVRTAAEKMLKNIHYPTIAASISLDGKAVACGLGVYERGYIGLYDIYVDSNYRRRGLGDAICRGIISEGTRLGAHTAYLQVLSDNDGARKLYRGMGFYEDYEYWFRLKREK